ncbi:MAG: amidohydrolase family protein [Dehalococcoidia bacterium]|nr:amidohydrolase family protein [Dehalococcoidia bacterium]
MIIDFHTHIFPDSLATKAMHVLTSEIDNLYPPVSDGTLSGLLEKMDQWRIDVSVIQPVVTKESQVKSANEWVASIVSDRIVGFGGIFPHTDNYKHAIDLVGSLGLKGLKFHPEYQDFVLDDDRMLRIYDYALGKGLILLFHAGYDPAFPAPFKSSPQRFANVMRAMRGGKIVAAHLGGHEQWDDVAEYLAGTEIFLDTSMGFEFFSTEQFLKIAEKHGAEKILFASDAPWSNAHSEIEHINALPLSESDKAAILGGNAQKLLAL